MSSNILSRPINVSKFGLIYAGAQKNIGPSGLTVVIIRDDLLSIKCDIKTPSILNYKIMADNKSMLNTPPCWSIYISGLVFKWIIKQGGIIQIYKNNQQKAKKLYEIIDSSDFYICPIEYSFRSIMTPVWFFNSNYKYLEDKFNKEAIKLKINGIEGHRTIGGYRAGFYNSQSNQTIQFLFNFLIQFKDQNKT
jgi:phosphoserine aminotransferase